MWIEVNDVEDGSSSHEEAEEGIEEEGAEEEMVEEEEAEKE